MRHFRQHFHWIFAIGLMACGAAAWAIQTQEVELGRAGSYDGAVEVTRDASGRLTFRDSEITTPTTLASLLASRFSYIEQFATIGAEGTAPVADGLGGLVMRGVATGAQLPLAISATGTLSIQNAAADGATRGAAAFNAANFTATDGVVNTAQNIGVTATPNFNGMTINGSASASWPLRVNVIPASGKDPQILVYDSADNQMIAELGQQQSIVGGARAILRMYYNATEQWRLGTGATDSFYNGGNFGIGNVSPAHKLDVTGDAAFSANGLALSLGSGTDADAYAQIGGRALVGYNSNGTASAAVFQGIAGKSIDLAVNSNTFGSGVALHIDQATGNVSIGNGSAAGAEKLDVTGNASVSGKLKIGAGGAILIGGQNVVAGPNLLDNPDFNIWQRGTSATANQGGDGGCTITHPVPGLQTLPADRWQASRAGTAMTATVSRDTPPGSLATAQYALKLTATAGAPCRFYIHQTLPRERTLPLRGRWVTFAVSVYENGAGGGNLAIYKTVGGVPTELARTTFDSTANGWDRVAIAAQVPADAETILVSVQPELSTSGTTAAWLANAALVAGRYVAAPERVTDPAASSVPAIPKSPARDLDDCQRYYEKGRFYYTALAPDSGLYSYYTTVGYNVAKAASPTVTISNLVAGTMAGVSYTVTDEPAYAAGASWPQGFYIGVSGNDTIGVPFGIRADWTAVCAEPI